MNFTDEEIRIKVAEACGWKPYKPITHDGWPLLMTPPGKPNKEGWLEPIHNYPADLNACASFESTLTDEEKPCYVKWLNASHPTSDIFYPDQSERGFNNNLAREVFGLVSATASQRCLAYLKTKGLLP